MTDLSPLLFRYMSEDDLSDVLKNERSAYSFPWSEAVMRECIGGISECWVGLLDQDVVAHGIISHVLDEGHLLNLCVGKAWQGQGFSHLFLEFLMKRLRDLHVEKVFLEVRQSNRVAISLYQGHGFKEIGIRRNYYPAGSLREDAVVMARELGVLQARV